MTNASESDQETSKVANAAPSTRNYYVRRHDYMRHIQICADCDQKLFVSKKDGHSYWTVNPCPQALKLLND
jgi:hypothetical protein